MSIASKKRLNEFFLAGLISLLIILFFNANFLASFFTQVPDKQFSGIIGVSTIDYSVYFSMIEQVKQGSVLVKNLYSTENLDGGMFHPLWLVLGKFASWFDLNSVSIYHWAKMVFGFVFLLFLYYLLRQLIKGWVWRLLALAGFGFSAGWGRWLSILTIDYFQGNELVRLLFGTDMWHNEGFVFLTLTHSSLFIATQLLLILSWWLSIADSKQKNIWAGLTLLILGLMHPYDILIFWSVLAVMTVLFVLQKKSIKDFIKNLWPSLSATGLLALYYAYLLLSDSNFSGWFNQNITLSPSFYAVLVGYGWLWLFSGYALWMLFRKFPKLDKKFIFLLAWYMTLPALMFAPINFSRRMIQTFGVVVVIMSVLGLKFWWERSGRQYMGKHFLSAAIISSIILLTLIITPLYQGVENLSVVINSASPGYINNEIIDVADEVKYLPARSVIFAPYFLAHIIPGRSGRFVYFGHPHQTVNFDKKHALAQFFFATSWSDWKKNFIKDNKIDYLIWPKTEQQDLPSSWQVWYENNSFIVYKISG